MMPRVSVIIPTYNCARFIGGAIESALAQTYKDYEVIVIDDGSTDCTGQIIERYQGKIRYYFQENLGLSAARNAALSKANGEFIAYLDADDMWYPPKLERQVTFLEERRDCGLVHSDVTIIDESNNVISRCFNAEQRRQPPEGACFISLLRRCHVQIPTVMERRECIDRVGNFDLTLRNAQDYYHWIKVAACGIRFGYIKEPLALYRWTNGSLSSSNRRVLEDFVMIFQMLRGDAHLLTAHDAAAMAIINEQLYNCGRELAYLERVDGDLYTSMRRLIGLIAEWPTRGELYRELLKTYLHPIRPAVRWLRGEA